MKTKIERAVAKAEELHAGQTRKGDGNTPYVVHPKAVADLLACHGLGTDVIVAALLHDTLEDTEYRPEEMAREFGLRVLELVSHVSDRRPKADWRERKVEYLNHIKEAPREACLISCADKISNLRDMIAGYKALGEALWDRFHATKEEKIGYYDDICRAISARFKHPLVRELEKTLDETWRCTC